MFISRRVINLLEVELDEHKIRDKGDSGDNDQSVHRDLSPNTIGAPRWSPEYRV